MDRFYYIQPWELLQNGAHQSVVGFAISKAKELRAELIACVHNKSSCEQFLQKCFGDADSKSLLNRKELRINGVPVKLESVKTLKNSFPSQERVYLAIFPSADLISEIESIESKKAIVVFSETQNSDHLIEWYKKFDAIELRAEPVV